MQGSVLILLNGSIYGILSNFLLIIQKLLYVTGKAQGQRVMYQGW